MGPGFENKTNRILHHYDHNHNHLRIYKVISLKGKIT